MISRRKDGRYFEYHLYKPGLYDYWFEISELMVLPERHKNVSRTKLQNRINKALNEPQSTGLKTLWDCLTVGPIYRQTEEGKNKMKPGVKTPLCTKDRDDWCAMMNILPVGSLSKYVR